MKDIMQKDKLNKGITTGCCGAAAAKATALSVFAGINSENVVVEGPKGDVFNVKVKKEPVHQVDVEAYAQECYSVKKYSGDDPDITNGCEVFCTLTVYKGDIALEKALEYADSKMFICSDYEGLYLDGGRGIGRVTLEGLGQPVGYAAINNGPQSMIFNAVGRAIDESDWGIYKQPYTVRILIEIPGGEELSKKTFNERLGIVGGLSVLGTTGVLEPMSNQAIIDTIETEIRQKSKLGERMLVLTPGNYGLSYIEKYLEYEPDKAVRCSNYIGDALDFAEKYSFDEVVLVGDIGKLCKLSLGIMNTHSHIADSRAEAFAFHTMRVADDSRDVVQRLLEAVNTEIMMDILKENGLFDVVLEEMMKSIRRHIGLRIKCKFRIIIFSGKYGLIGDVKS